MFTHGVSSVSAVLVGGRSSCRIGIRTQELGTQHEEKERKQKKKERKTREKGRKKGRKNFHQSMSNWIYKGCEFLLSRTTIIVIAIHEEMFNYSAARCGLTGGFLGAVLHFSYSTNSAWLNFSYSISNSVLRQPDKKMSDSDSATLRSRNAVFHSEQLPLRCTGDTPDSYEKWWSWSRFLPG